MGILEDKLKLFREMSYSMNDDDPYNSINAKMFYAGKETCLSMWRQFMEGRHEANVALYFHIPFCERNKCNYCMYDSKIIAKRSELDAYLDYIVEAIEYYAPVFREAEMSNLYIGGGTPSTLSRTQLGRFLGAVNRNFAFSGDSARNCEVSPSTVDEEKLRELRKNGINRISIGVQSLNRETMRLAKRRFVPYEDITSLVECIKDLGFEEINMDLMGDLPLERPEDFAASFEKALKLDPTTITTYFFRATDNVRYPEEIISKHIDTKNIEHRTAAVEMLERIAGEHGFFRHGVSNFSLSQGFVNGRQQPRLKGFRTHWDAEDGNSCLGIGIGARSFLLDVVEYFDAGSSGTPGQKISDALEGEMDFKTTRHLVISHGKYKRMRNYFVRSLYKNMAVDLKSFRRLYNADALDVFKDSLDALEKLRKIEIRGGSVLSKMEDEMEWNIFTKFFLTEEEIEYILNAEEKFNLYS